jgi:ribose/xylose/arabinose/galactoside ABC-type transport system permease subunit
MVNSGWSRAKAYMSIYALAGAFTFMAGIMTSAINNAPTPRLRHLYGSFGRSGDRWRRILLPGGVVTLFGAVCGAVSLTMIGVLLGLLKVSTDFTASIQGLVLILILSLRLLKGKGARYEEHEGKGLFQPERKLDSRHAGKHRALDPDGAFRQRHYDSLADRQRIHRVVSCDAGLAQMLVVTTGRGAIDLSIPGMITLGAYVSMGVCNGSNAMIIPALLLVILLGVIVGLLNSSMVIFLGIRQLLRPWR